ncbi:MAG: fasciclin domain-containing protein, partial [Polaromonas sp.]|nr:fasciclin domain-containing protein [Polaromonas sp.]
MSTKHKLASLGLALAMSLAGASAFAQVMVGGASMLPSKDI